MAEFQEVMRQWRRMCAEISCPDCEIFDYCEGLPSADIDKIQRIVTTWAAEHPEPVYPTWGEWLQRMYNSMNYAGIFITPIPADIAEKLGIEPKEG